MLADTPEDLVLVADPSRESVHPLPKSIGREASRGREPEGTAGSLGWMSDPFQLVARFPVTKWMRAWDSNDLAELRKMDARFDDTASQGERRRHFQDARCPVRVRFLMFDLTLSRLLRGEVPEPDVGNMYFALQIADHVAGVDVHSFVCPSPLVVLPEMPCVGRDIGYIALRNECGSTSDMLFEVCRITAAWNLSEKEANPNTLRFVMDVLTVCGLDRVWEPFGAVERLLQYKNGRTKCAVVDNLEDFELAVGKKNQTRRKKKSSLSLLACISQPQDDDSAYYVSVQGSFFSIRGPGCFGFDFLRPDNVGNDRVGEVWYTGVIKPIGSKISFSLLKRVSETRSSVSIQATVGSDILSLSGDRENYDPVVSIHLERVAVEFTDHATLDRFEHEVFELRGSDGITREFGRRKMEKNEKELFFLISAYERLFQAEFSYCQSALSDASDADPRRREILRLRLNRCGPAKCAVSSDSLCYFSNPPPGDSGITPRFDTASTSASSLNRPLFSSFSSALASASLRYPESQTKISPIAPISGI